jgi:hypothetical protein
MQMIEYPALVAATVNRHAAADGSIPAVSIARLNSDLVELMEKVAQEARDDGYEEGHLGEDL